MEIAMDRCSVAWSERSCIVLNISSKFSLSPTSQQIKGPESTCSTETNEQNQRNASQGAPHCCACRSPVGASMYVYVMTRSLQMTLKMHIFINIYIEKKDKLVIY
jgi:hypothetical protein